MCAQSCLTLWDPMDCSLPGPSIHGSFLARILEWVAISSFRGSSQPRDRTFISFVSCIGRWTVYHWATIESNQGSVCNVGDEIKHRGQPHGSEFCGYCYHMKSFYQLISQQQLRKKGTYGLDAWKKLNILLQSHGAYTFLYWAEGLQVKWSRSVMSKSLRPHGL